MVEDQATIAPPHEEKKLMQRDEHSSYFCIPLHHDEVAARSEERLDISENPHPTIIIEDIHEPPRIAGGKEETNIHEKKRKCKSLQHICSQGEDEFSHEIKIKMLWK